MPDSAFGRDLIHRLNQRDGHLVGITSSPSSTTEITIDIVESREASRVQGQLVYVVLPEEDYSLVVLGQIVNVETRNQWHEDLAFRGIVKRHHELPHLSGIADVREARISVQAVYRIDPDTETPAAVSESAGLLAISPATGARVYEIDDEVLTQLLERYSERVVYLGHAHGTNVQMPMWFKHFGEQSDGGAGEAYHIGVFGMTGSGKSGMSAYLALSYARHPQMGLVVIDPQGQFTSNVGLPFNLHDALRNLKRPVETYAVRGNLRLQPDYELFTRVLRMTDFFRQLGVRHPTNQEFAEAEIETVARATPDFWRDAKHETLREVLTRLAKDDRALARIYSGDKERQRILDAIQHVLDDNDAFARVAQESWLPVHELFAEKDANGNSRADIWQVLGRCTGVYQSGVRPVVFLDLSAQGSTSRFLDDTTVKALILRQVTRVLQRQAEAGYQKADNDRWSVNCLVMLDEAHRYAAQRPGDEAMQALTRAFIDGVRTTRKYGLGWMFITQTLASLNTEIIQQLRINAFGYGLTSGKELEQLRDMVGDPAALALYRSFVDPSAVTPRQFPFMFLGPASPLSFTGAPLFLDVYNDFAQFLAANPGFKRDD